MRIVYFMYDCCRTVSCYKKNTLMSADDDDFYCNIFINILYVYVVCVRYAAAGHMLVRRRIGAEIRSVIICTRAGGILCV